MRSFLTVFISAYGGEPIDPEWIQMTTGEYWKQAYGQKPYVIIDVTEVPMETPDDTFMQRLFYSHYKKRYVCKFLGACQPNCLAAFCSVGFPGSIFDNEICFAGDDHPMRYTRYTDPASVGGRSQTQATKMRSFRKQLQLIVAFAKG